MGVGMVDAGAGRRISLCTEHLTRERLLYTTRRTLAEATSWITVESPPAEASRARIRTGLRAVLFFFAGFEDFRAEDRFRHVARFVPVFTVLALRGLKQQSGVFCLGYCTLQLPIVCQASRARLRHSWTRGPRISKRKGEGGRERPVRGLSSWGLSSFFYPFLQQPRNGGL